MKKLLTGLLILFSSIGFSQTVQNSMVVPDIATMKTYVGSAARIFVSANNSTYNICSACTTNEIDIFAGAGGKKWKLQIADTVKADLAKIGLKVNISDTATFRQADRNSRLAVSDTAAMRTADRAAAAAADNLRLLKTDTAAFRQADRLVASNVSATKLAIADTAGMRLNDRTALIAIDNQRLKIADTAAARQSDRAFALSLVQTQTPLAFGLTVNLSDSSIAVDTADTQFRAFITRLGGGVSAALSPGDRGNIFVVSESIWRINANAIRDTMINNLAVTNNKINDVAWSKVTGRATTLSGYGITDAVPLNGAGGTPTSITLTNGTGLPLAGITGFGTGVSAFLGTPSSANLRTAVTDETGTGGGLVFATGPTLSNPVVGTQTAGNNSTLAASTAFVQTALTAVTATLDSVYVQDITTTTATPQNGVEIWASPSSEVTVTMEANAVLSTGAAGYGATRKKRYLKIAAGTLTHGGEVVMAADEYLGTGLSTATMRFVSTGDIVYPVVTGEASKTIYWRITYTVSRRKIP